jgi:peptidyl-prolyl cis-trans isomerase C
MKILKEPLLHFLLLGVLLFAVNAWRTGRRAEAGVTARVEVTAAVIERLRAGYERQFGQKPDETELRGLITAHIREEVLSREALALGLDRDDTIVRRRLAQKMEFLTDDLAVAAEPDAAALGRFFETNAARYARPARVSFRHVYFSREKRGAGADATAREALAALAKGASDAEMGDAFLHGFEFAERGPEDLTALFGPEFAMRLSALPVSAWSGPISSSYGLHLVRVEARSEPKAASLVEVRTTVVRDFQEERRQAANREVFERLKQRYEITVDESAITNRQAVKLAEADR